VNGLVDRAELNHVDAVNTIYLYEKILQKASTIKKDFKFQQQRRGRGN